MDNQQFHACRAAQVDSSSLVCKDPASLSTSPHISSGLGGLGAFSEPFCRKALWGSSRSRKPAFLGLGSLSSRSTGGSSGLSVTLSLGPRLSKLCSWELRASHPHRRVSCGIARHCRGVKSGVTGERSQTTHSPLSSVAFSSLHRCPSIRSGILGVPFSPSAGRYLSNLPSPFAAQKRPTVGLGWDVTLGQRGGYRFCFVLLFCFVSPPSVLDESWARWCLLRALDSPSPGMGLEVGMGERGWNSLNLREAPSPLPPRAGRRRQPLEDAVSCHRERRPHGHSSPQGASVAGLRPVGVLADSRV